MSDAATGRRSPEVLIVGAGPVGLLLGLDLHRSGVDVTVIDARPGPTRTGSRATTLNSRSMHILQTRGLLDEIGEIPQILMAHFAGLPLDLEEDVAFAGQWKLPQTRLESVLMEVGAREGLDLRWNCGLTGAASEERGSLRVFTRSGPDELEWTPDFLVGCDGENSTVRSGAGIELCGDPGSRRLMRADVTGVDVVSRRFHVVDGGMITAATLPSGSTRVMAHAHSDAAPHDVSATFDDLTRVWAELTGEDLSTGSVQWFDAFTDSAQWAERFRVGRILLAGDAAHVYMPAGGMAMNLGLQDAVDLSWRLAAVVHGHASESALDDYERVARANAERVATSVAAQAHLLLSPHDLGPQRVLMADLLDLESVRSDIRSVVSGLGLGERPTDRPQSLVGRSSPSFDVADSSGTVTSVGEHLRCGRSVLVLSGTDQRPGVATALTLPNVEVLIGRIVLADGDVPLLQQLDGLDAFLIEPTGRIGWTESEPGSLGRYFVEDVKYTMRQHSPQSRSAVLDVLPRGMREVIAAGSAERSGTLAGAQALVTGASRGIGRGIALRLAADGAAVAVHCAHQPDRAEQVVAEIKRAGGAAFAITAQFDTPAHLREMTAAVASGFAEISERPIIDILVNNAGVLGGESFAETSEGKFDDLMRVNVKAPFFLTQEVLKVMPDGGRIINISTGLTKIANPDEIAYSMTKGAIEQLTRHLAKGLASREITVNAVAPGVTDNGSEIFGNPQAVEMMSQLSPFGRVGQPEDIAAAVAFLASGDSRWITGSVIEASGGTVLG